MTKKVLSLLDRLVNVFAHTILRPIPTLIGCILVVLFSLIIFSVATLYSYSINDISILIQFYIIGYIIGCLYEYIHLLMKSTRS